jgi:general secretion pathway protein G
MVLCLNFPDAMLPLKTHLAGMRPGSARRAQLLTSRARLDIPMPFSNTSTVMRHPKDSLRRGFTLIEILVVISIISLLAGLVIANMDNIFGNSQKDVAKLMVTQTLKTPLMTYRFQMGSYPTTEEGLASLMVAPANKADRWRGPYLDENTKLPLLDPWKNPYQYRYPGVHNKDSYDLWSNGPPSSDGTDASIGNW